jgi:hypothetical protein
MSGKELRQSRDQTYAADSVRYEKATGYKVNERVPFEDAAVLITGTRWPREAETRLRAALSFGVIGVVLPSDPPIDPNSFFPVDTNCEDNPRQRRRFSGPEIDEFIACWRIKGFDRTELTAWAALAFEATKAKTAAARCKNLVKAREVHGKRALTIALRRLRTST